MDSIWACDAPGPGPELDKQFNVKILDCGRLYMLKYIIERLATISTGKLADVEIHSSPFGRMRQSLG